MFTIKEKPVNSAEPDAFKPRIHLLEERYDNVNDPWTFSEQFTSFNESYEDETVNDSEDLSKKRKQKKKYRIHKDPSQTESARQHNSLSPFTLVLFVLTVLLALIFHQQQLKVTLTVEKYDDKSHMHREGKEKENENTAIATDNDDTESITNFFDHTILSFLEEGEQLLKEFKYKECEQFFEKLQKEFPSSPRAVYGRARCMEKLADRYKDGKLLEKALEEYMKIVKIPSVPPQLANRSLASYGKKYLYLKMPYKAIDGFRQLLAYFPNDPFALNQLGLSLLHIGEYEESLTLFQRSYNIRESGWLKVHIGYIYNSLARYVEAIPWLVSGINTREEGVDEARFYFTLAESYARTDRRDKALKIYDLGAKRGLFLSTYQRSLHNAATQLRARPWWVVEETSYQSQIRLLEQKWRIIRLEAFSIFGQKQTGFHDFAVHLVVSGMWQAFFLYMQGKQITENCIRAPVTCKLLQKMKEISGNVRGEVKFIALDPKTHIWPHTGSTNCRLRVVIPLALAKETSLRVAEATSTLQQGKAVVIDDSFEFEYKHNGSSVQILLMADFWHPDVPEWERETLYPVSW